MKEKVFVNKKEEVDALKYAFSENIFTSNIKKEEELVKEFLSYLNSKLNEDFSLINLVFHHKSFFKKELKEFLKEKDIKPVYSIGIIFKDLLFFYDDYDEDDYEEDDDYEDEDDYDDEDEDDDYKENESCFLDKNTQKFISDLYEFLRNYDFK